MKIGVDFDGVILDSEERVRFYAEYYSWFDLGKKRIKTNEVDQDSCFDWTMEESERFYKTYFIDATETAPFVAGALEIMKKLQSEGHKFYIISRRGVDGEFEVEHALKKLEAFDFKFDGLYFNEINKSGRCKKLKLDVFIDDNPGNVEMLSGLDMKILYFKDIRIKKVIQENVVQVENWMEVYHFINKLQNKTKNV